MLRSALAPVFFLCFGPAGFCQAPLPNLFEQDSNEMLVEFLDYESSFPKRFAIRTKVDWSEVYEDFRTIDGHQWLLVDREKKIRRVLNEFQIIHVRDEDREESECSVEGFEAEGKYFAIAWSDEPDFRCWVQYKDRAQSTGDVHFFDPRNLWLWSGEQYYLSVDSGATMILHDTQCVASSKAADSALTSIFSRENGSGKNRVTEITWKDGKPVKSRFLPYVEGGFTWQKFTERKKQLAKNKKKHDYDVHVTNEWKKDRSGNVVLARTFVTTTEGESSAEQIFDNVWLFEEEIPDRYFADPRIPGTPSLKDLQFR